MMPTRRLFAESIFGLDCRFMVVLAGTHTAVSVLVFGETLRKSTTDKFQFFGLFRDLAGNAKMCAPARASPNFVECLVNIWFSVSWLLRESEFDWLDYLDGWADRTEDNARCGFWKNSLLEHMSYRGRFVTISKEQQYRWKHLLSRSHRSLLTSFQPRSPSPLSRRFSLTFTVNQQRYILNQKQKIQQSTTQTQQQPTSVQTSLQRCGEKGFCQTCSRTSSHHHLHDVLVV